MTKISCTADEKKNRFEMHILRISYYLYRISNIHHHLLKKNDRFCNQMFKRLYCVCR